MKKVIITLMLGLFCFSVVGCGGYKTESTSQEKTKEEKEAEAAGKLPN